MGLSLKIINLATNIYILMPLKNELHYFSQIVMTQPAIKGQNVSILLKIFSFICFFLFWNFTNFPFYTMKFTLWKSS